ncbi:DUF4249 domain-containing protein [Ekhidna sp.]|uniref:DUF4249 domain-containing protein n=1 Tax=Ekhidna sp. TaxID=2608089 RepID=UPI0035183456
MKRIAYILILGFFACEEVVVVDLPAPQNLIVVEGWLSDSLGRHPIRITRSNGFADKNSVIPIEDAQVLVQSKTGEVFSYSYNIDGYYLADADYEGTSRAEYRVLIELDTFSIRSEWDEMPERVLLENLQVDSFEDNDPDDPDRQITIYYPKITTPDPAGQDNFYRWLFFKNGERFNEPEPITIQNDRLFDGNLIPNNFQNFDYEIGDEMTVHLLSISPSSFNYLSLLRSQITTLGTSSGTTPAVVTGNLSYVNVPNRQVLGYFGTAAMSYGTLTVQ